MRNVLKIFVVTYCAFGLLACDDSQSTQAEVNPIKRAQTVFEGTWTWIKTEGSGIAGPYVSDSIKVGYSLHYEFGFKDLQSYRNGKEDSHYTYTFNAAESPEKQVLTLINDSGNKESYLWELKNVNDISYLMLRNVEPCCDNTFEKQFRLIAQPKITGK